MTIVLRGVMQSQVTPLKDDFSLDVPTYERLVDVRTGPGGLKGAMRAMGRDCGEPRGW